MDSLDQDVLLSALAGTIFARDIRVLDEIDSTNSAAMLAAQAGAPEGTAFVAERQTEGRGRGGNAWYSEPGAIYLSVLLRPRLNATDVLILSLATGLAVSAAVESVCGITPDLRWPNDIMLGGKKLGGILCELNLDGDVVRHAVIGVGINVNQQRFPEDIRDIATSLFQETGKQWPRVDLIGAFLQHLHAEYQSMQASPKGAMRSCIQRFEQRSSYARGKRVKVEGFEGITAGLDARGFLRVKSGDEVKTVVSGGVRPA